MQTSIVQSFPAVPECPGRCLQPTSVAYDVPRTAHTSEGTVSGSQGWRGKDTQWSQAFERSNSYPRLQTGRGWHKADVWTTELVFVIGLLTTKASLFLWMLAPGKGFPSSTVTCCRGMQYSFSTELQTVFYVRLFARHIECAGAKKLVCTANSFFFFWKKDLLRSLFVFRHACCASEILVFNVK